MKISVAAFCAALVVAPFVMTGSASAQSNDQLTTVEVFHDASPEEVVENFKSAGYVAEIIQSNAATEVNFRITYQGNLAYFVALRNCKPSGQTTFCSMIQPFAFFSGQGVTLSMMNDFMRQRAETSFLTLNPNNVGVITTKIYLDGGVAGDHIIASLNYFEKDLTALLTSMQSGALAKVSSPKGALAAVAGLSFIPATANDILAVGLTLPDGASDRFPEKLTNWGAAVKKRPQIVE